jgi:hypothetical protein
MNTVNELNQELLVMKEAYEQLDAEKQVLISQLEKQPVETDQEQARQTISMVLISRPSHKIIDFLLFQRKYHPIYSNNHLKKFVSYLSILFDIYSFLFSGSYSYQWYER